MKNVLVIKSSILAAHSQSNQLVDYAVAKLADKTITTRDVAAKPLPYFTGDAASATRGEPQSAEQKALAALSDEVIAELNHTDLLVLAAPMYNFGIPAQLKSYFDFACRAGVTFRYTETGPEGLIKGKKAIVILTTGGLHKDGPTDLARQYVQTLLGFIGITDVEFVYAEALGYGAEAVEKAQKSAKAELDRIIATL